MATDRRLIAALRRELKAAADPERAPRMQAYMKSVMPYYGVAAPGVRKITRAVFDDHPLDGVDAWRDTVLELWRKAKFREERYAAIALTAHKRYRVHQVPDVALPIYDEMIVTGAWWDYVDDVSIHRVGLLLGSHPKVIRPVMLRWSTDTDLWRRRCSIICQISFRGDADLELLYACIEANLADKDFFIRKGIGWALRTLAWSKPDEVVRYVEANQTRLSPLSQREALKNVRGRRSG
jgi:3-methyladenine DNA glycosylase AlkD